jgi:baculoviral IAP repeat-containing protein 6
LAPSGDKIIARTRRILDIKDVLHPYLECPKCKTAACVACHQRSAEQGKDLPNRQSRQGVSVAWCCDEGRLFLIWSLCCGPEYEELSESVGKAPTFTRLLRKARSKGQYPESSVLSPIKPKESTPRALSKGIGYGGDEIQYAQAVVAGAPPVYTDAQPFLSGDKAHNLPEERLLPAYFTSLDILLTGFLIGGSEAELSDAQPPAMIKFMLQRSPLLPKAAELLRNDSMEDMAERRQTYEPLLGLVRTIGRYVSISVAVFDDYMLYAPEEQLVHYSPAWRDMNESSTSGGRQSQRGKGKQPESGTAIVKAVERLARQCRHINRVTSDKDDLKSADSSAMLSLSRLICDVATENEANKRLAAKHRSSAVPQPVGQMQGASNVLTRSRGAEKASDDLRDLHRDASVVDVADKELLNGFKFQAQAAGLDGVIPAPGRMKKLVSQIAMLRTSLPEGIWVRHGSSRLDVMKVLITGPKGTPYENGLFEFDLLCPMDFPARPPTMFFRTTGAGRVRFNPNLYEDGKGASRVALSAFCWARLTYFCLL